MQQKPILVVMAAGMGSRYGGLKQIDPVGPNREIIMDYSLFDAKKAGFERVIFIIKEENREAFDEAIGKRIAGQMQVDYAYQRLDDLPDGYGIPEGRIKPWGTGHAVLAARDLIDAPFAVINADDFYGFDAFAQMYGFLSRLEEKEPAEYAMIAYKLRNTLSEHGHVARGVCEIDDSGYLSDIVERLQIIKTPQGAAFSEDGGESWQAIDDESAVSMNFFGFPASFVKQLQRLFPDFLDQALKENPEKGEFLLPTLVDLLIKDRQAVVRAMTCSERWFGVTYQQDKPIVMQAIAERVDQGTYPRQLWES